MVWRLESRIGEKGDLIIGVQFSGVLSSEALSTYRLAL
jgi:hypothetical protein